MLWHKAQGAGGFGGNTFLLDTYSGAEAAYSLRKLSSSTTNGMQIIRDSDSATQDIGFIGSDLDTASIESFCSGTTGRINIWYDQSGNGIDLDTNDKPVVYSGGAVKTANSLPFAEFRNCDFQSGAFTPSNTGDTSFSLFAVARNLETGGVAASRSIISLYASSYAEDRRNIEALSRDSGSLYSLRLRGGFTSWSETMSLTNMEQHSNIYGGGGGAIDAWINGTSSTVSGSSNSGLDIQSSSFFRMGFGGVTFNTQTNDGDIQEAIWFLSDQSSNRSNIEADQSSYWGT